MSRKRKFRPEKPAGTDPESVRRGTGRVFPLPGGDDEPREVPPRRSEAGDTVPVFRAIDPAALRQTALGPDGGAADTQRAPVYPQGPGMAVGDGRSTGGREVSIFADTQPRRAPRPPVEQSSSGGGDTQRLRTGEIPGAVRDPQPGQPQRLRRRVNARIEDVPLRRPRQAGGFFSAIFGFFGLIFKMIVVTGLVMGLGVGIGYLAIRWYVKTKEITVPNVRGMKLGDAVDVLSPKKLYLIKERAEASSRVSPGEIIDQRPPAGTAVKENTPIRVIVSSGRANFMVPDVIGETRDNAINKIKGARLEMGNITYLEDPKVPKDSVINQVPEPNKGLDQPAKVDLLISSGPRGSAFPMPDVTGKSLADARAALAKVGITDIVTDPPGATAGSVSAQDPLVGKLVLQSHRVILTVAR